MGQRIEIPSSHKLLTDPRFRKAAALFRSLNSRENPQTGKIWKPHEGQLYVGQQFFIEGKRRGMVVCGRKWGKHLSLDEVVPTPNGYRQVSDLREGDALFAVDGSRCAIIGMSPIEFRQIYRVDFSDGAFVMCSDTHEWVTSTKASRKSNARAKQPVALYERRTTTDIAATLRVGREWNHAVPCAEPTQTHDVELPLDPYILGLWLGDGTHCDARFATVDEEILASLREQFTVRHIEGCDYYIKKLIPTLRRVGVVRNKHIPKQYLWAGTSQRLALVQGLMDTDGTCEANGRCRFENTNKHLIDGMCLLLSSLGEQFKLSERRIEGHKTCYRVAFYPANIQPFRLSRKRSRVKTRGKPHHRFIVKVTATGIGRCRCLAIDHESHQYLCGQRFIPTHNTEVSLDLAWRFGNLINNGQIYYFAAEQAAAKEIIWSSSRIQEWGPSDYIAGVNNSEMRLTWTSGTFIKIDGADNFKGKKGFNPDVVILDEAADYPDSFWRAMGPNFAAKDCIVLIITSPPWKLEDEPGKPTLFMRMVELYKNHPRYFFLNSPTHVNAANLPPGFLEQEEKDLKETGEEDQWNREYLAQFTVSTGTRIIPTFVKEVHVRPHEEVMRRFWNDRESFELVTSIDPGSVYGAVFKAINQYTKEVLWLDELYVKEMKHQMVEDFWPKVLEKQYELAGTKDPERWRTVYDEAAKWFFIEVTNRFGAELTPTEKARNDVLDGLSLLRTIFAYNKGFMSDRCKWTCWEFENYRRDDRGNIPKKNDHNIDNCLLGSTLVDTIEGQIPIKDLVGKVGYLYSQNGTVRRFADARLTRRNAKVLKVCFTDGTEITCTPDHKFLTLAYTWQEAQYLRNGVLIQRATYESEYYKRDAARVWWENIHAACRRALLFPWTKQPITSSGVAGAFRADSEGAAYSSHRLQLRQQPDREFVSDDRKGTYQLPYDKGAQGVVQAEYHEERSPRSASLALHRGRPQVAQRERQKGARKSGASKKVLRVLWEGIRDYLHPQKLFSILPFELQDGSTTATVASVEDAGIADTYCLTVDGTHCLSVQGGIIVHNSRYALHQVDYYIGPEDRPVDVKVPEWMKPRAPSLEEDMAEMLDSGDESSLAVFDNLDEDNQWN